MNRSHANDITTTNVDKQTTESRTHDETTTKEVITPENITHDETTKEIITETTRRPATPPTPSQIKPINLADTGAKTTRDTSTQEPVNPINVTNSDHDTESEPDKDTPPSPVNPINYIITATEDTDTETTNVPLLSPIKEITTNTTESAEADNSNIYNLTTLIDSELENTSDTTSEAESNTSPSESDNTDNSQSSDTDIDPLEPLHDEEHFGSWMDQHTSLFRYAYGYKDSDHYLIIHTHWYEKPDEYVTMPRRELEEMRQRITETDYYHNHNEHGLSKLDRDKLYNARKNYHEALANTNNGREEADDNNTELSLQHHNCCSNTPKPATKKIRRHPELRDADRLLRKHQRTTKPDRTVTSTYILFRPHIGICITGYITRETEEKDKPTLHSARTETGPLYRQKEKWSRQQLKTRFADVTKNKLRQPVLNTLIDALQARTTTC